MHSAIKRKQSSRLPPSISGTFGMNFLERSVSHEDVPACAEIITNSTRCTLFYQYVVIHIVTRSSRVQRTQDMGQQVEDLFFFLTAGLKGGGRRDAMTDVATYSLLQGPVTFPLKLQIYKLK